MLFGLGAASLAVLALGAVVVGFSKTAVAGFGPVATVLFTSVLGARAATGAILVLLIACDLVAISSYRRSCDWRLVRVLLPSLVIGIALGAWFVTLVDDTGLRRTVGVLLLLMSASQLIQAHAARRSTRTGDAPLQHASPDEAPGAPDPDGRSPHRAVGLAAGSAAGFTTMTANAAGPVMSLYLLHLGVSKYVFVGTSAWFYFLANLVKMPFAVGIGLVHPGSLGLNLALVIPAMAGCLLGLKVLPRIPQQTFDRLALWLAVGSSLLLLR